ncbi:hypothetical protein ACF1G0_01710 [Streptomyces sp. NPDC013953]|uniref:hypothetical protein n=1 Tax=Streptomyces sp. NPDC013953 TaxID=3364868 RepID=UPI003702C41B
MDAKPACGPERDPEFFEEVGRLFAKYPEAAGRYAVKCRRLELEILRIDFQKKIGVTSVEDGRIVTEFVDRDTVDDPSELTRMCCEWPDDDDGLCNWICPK